MHPDSWPTAPGSAGRPLHGVRVLDVSRILAGPYCTMVLADLGADVVKVEPPAGDETRRWGPPFFRDTAAYYFVANRNKRSVALDLKTESGRVALRSLMERADVLVQNFTADLASEFGVDAAGVRAVNPRCIHVTLSGYGPTQPNRRGYDLMAQALGGLISVTGERDSTGVKVGVPVVDLFAGLHAALAVAAALAGRSAESPGATIEVSLMDSAAALLANQAMNWLLCGSLPVPLGNDHPNVVPYGVFPTATEPVVIAVASDGQFVDMCSAIGRADLAVDERYRTNGARVANREQLTRSLGEHLQTLPASEWSARLAAKGIPVGTVRTVAQALASEDVSNVGSIAHPKLGEIKQVLSPVRLDGRRLEAILPPPLLDESRDEVLP